MTGEPAQAVDKLGDAARKMLGAAVHPVTGELLDLRGSSAVVLADALEELGRHYDALADFKAAIVGEVCRRADKMNARTVELDGVKWEVNAPTADTYNLGELLAALRPFTEGDDPTLDPSILDTVVRRPPPKPPSPEVDKRELGKLWKSDDRELLAALARVRQRGAPKRTAKVLARPVDTTAEELPDA